MTTPRYNTAITAVTNGAYPYGGIDLARLYDDRQEVASTLGARVPAGFGIVARNRCGRIRLATARPASSRAERPPLRLLRAPRGVGSAGSTLRPFAGAFDVLRVTGRRAAGGVDARSTYTFRRNSIIGEWTVRATTKLRRNAEALFPSTGGERATVWALLRDGQVVPVSEPRPVMGVAAFWVQSERSGYVVEPLDRVKGATASIIQPQPAAVGARARADAVGPLTAASHASGRCTSRSGSRPPRTSTPPGPSSPVSPVQRQRELRACSEAGSRSIVDLSTVTVDNPTIGRPARPKPQPPYPAEVRALSQAVRPSTRATASSTGSSPRRPRQATPAARTGRRPRSCR